jgi:hypothetical protein
MNSSDNRMVRTGSRPVAGLPPLFGFGNTTLDFGMFWYYHNSKPEGSVNFRPGSNSSQEVQFMAQADSKSITVPLSSLISDRELRRIFWQAGRDLGDEFAVPAVPQKVLDGGAAAEVAPEYA